MRNQILFAGIAVAAIIPALSFAQPTCVQEHDNQVAATVAGGGLGALIGSAIAPRDDRFGGAVIGGVGGAVVGNSLSRTGGDCANAYGFYDQDGLWHANVIDRAAARGYYDRNGAWVDGAPNGYYDGQGRWIVETGVAPSASGYYDNGGRWVPASAGGYYNDRGQWVASVSGYYDQDGRWNAGQTSGAYDVNGQWMPGAQSGQFGVNGIWIADAQPGYYDSRHHWRTGPTRGYYDSRGVWIAASMGGDAYGPSLERSRMRQRGFGLREQELEQRIRSDARDGRLSRDDAHRDLIRLGSIRHQEAGLRDDQGRISPQGESDIENRLNRLGDSLGGS